MDSATLKLLILPAALALGLGFRALRDSARTKRREQLGWFAHTNGWTLARDTPRPASEDWMNCYLFL
ncbi:MAG: hypothetical protein NTX64_14745, partial [Elusimicrobia bacterium]|nr:hypothetical protein [Elusimicrobiota bacterium]